MGYNPFQTNLPTKAGLHVRGSVLGVIFLFFYYKKKICTVFTTVDPIFAHTMYVDVISIMDLLHTKW